jgi:RluA family pseudouridine synthase
MTVHRLDKDTSGVLVLARNADAHRSLNTQFSEQRVRKVYHAIVMGTPSWMKKSIQLPLRTNVGRRKRTVVDPQRGKPAATTFSLLSVFESCALLEALPETGRTHQIRAHLYSLGFPVLADPLYGPGKPSIYISRLALHAHILSFQHPQTGIAVSFTAAYPDDFKLALDALRGKPPS